MVYKYYPPTCHTCDALTNEYFFFCKASIQNDPYDMSFKLLKSNFILQNLGYAEDEHKDVESIMGNYGICCFSEVKDNKHLWAFYADNYKGMVVGFDENKFYDYYNSYMIRIPFVKVTYRNSPITDDDVIEKDDEFKLEMPVLLNSEANRDWLKPHKYANCIDDPKLGDMLFTHLCSIKEKRTWSEEKEVRLIAAMDIINGRARLEKKGFVYLDTGYKIPIPKDCVKEIYIGHNYCSSKFGIVENIAKKYGIKQVFQTKVDTPFEIEFDDITKQFNL